MNVAYSSTRLACHMDLEELCEQEIVRGALFTPGEILDLVLVNAGLILFRWKLSPKDPDALCKLWRIQWELGIFTPRSWGLPWISQP